MFIALSGIFGLIGLICWLIILVDAFKDSILKGLFGLLCGLYLLYYAIFEFEHKNKWAIVILWLLFWGLSGTTYRMNAP